MLQREIGLQEAVGVRCRAVSHSVCHRAADSNAVTTLTTPLLSRCLFRTSLPRTILLHLTAAARARFALVPRAFPWPAPIMLDEERRRPSRRIVRTPVLNDMQTRANLYEGKCPAKRAKKTQ